MEATSDFKYLQKLNFDPQQYKTLVYKLVNNFRSVALLILLILGIGSYSFINIPRELNPDINIPIVGISVSLPGANPKDIESLIIEPLEKAIAPLEEVDYIESTANQSFASIVVYLKDGVDKNQIVSEIRTEIEAVELPNDASTPKVQTIDFSEQPVLQTSVVSELDLLSLSKAAKGIKTELEKSPSVKKVELNGQIEDRINLSLKLENIQKYNTTPGQLINALNASNINLPSGNFEINNVEYQIAIDNSIKSIEDVRSLILNVNGQNIPISEIAEVSLKPDPNFNNSIYFYEKGGSELKSVELKIYKSNNSQIDEAVSEASRIIDSYLKENKNFRRVDITNEAQNINEQFDDLTNNFVGTMILVFIVLFVFLGIKQASVASVSIPLTFLTTFIFMGILGITINFISLFSLLIALGLVVDNAIVVVSGYNMYRKSGKFNAIETALMVYKDFKVPILTTTLTTVWAFLPLLLSTGIIGEYIKTIPIVVSISLIASASIAIYITLALMAISNSKIASHVKKVLNFGFYIISIFFIFVLLSLIFYRSPNPNSQYLPILRILLIIFSIFSVVLLAAKIKKLKIPNIANSKINFLNKGILNFGKVTNVYESQIRNILFSRTKKITVIIITLVLLVISITFAFTGLLKSEFFPKSDSEILYINFTGPPGWTDKKLEPFLEDAVEIISELNELKFMTVVQGFNIESSQSLSSGNNLAYIIVRIVDKADRKIDSMEIAEELRNEINEKIDINTSIIEFSGGPPVGADIQLNIQGDDFKVLEEINNKFMDLVKSTPGVINVESTLNQSSGQISINLSNTELAKRQLTAQEVSFWLRSVVSGTEVNEISNGSEEDTKIFVEVDRTYNLSDIENLIIPSMNGNKYSLSEIAEILLENSPTKIDRKDGKKIVSILGYVTKGESSTEIYNIRIKPLLDKIEIPEGYVWNIGGVNEQNQDSVNSILSQMLLSFMLILTTMVLEMNSFRKALLVLLIIPIAVCGVLFNFTVFGIPLSFPALIGILALFGIVVNNTIMLIEKISQNHKIGLEYTEGIVDACSSRLEPIFFTTATTIAGLLPITLSDPLWQGLGGAIIAGLSFSGIIILFLLPVVYSWVFKKNENL
ncbi:efflux RND transporter permease subunit [Candidatus Dojkabacteria bacterium]|nr:efflux RND transporter permease subunit [Candidatus Dojkabacteria bacterium]